MLYVAIVPSSAVTLTDAEFGPDTRPVPPVTDAVEVAAVGVATIVTEVVP